MGDDLKRGKDADPNHAPPSVPFVERLAALEQHDEELRRHVEHVHRLEVDVLTELTRLSAICAHLGHLTARPQVADDALLHVTDGSGRLALGFVDHNGAANRASRYSDFEQLFRGSREEIQRRQEVYVNMVRRGTGPVLDLGCGRGEFLELLQREGIAGWGVDLDEGMVAQAVALGLDAKVGDLFEILEDHSDGSLGGVFSAQVIEHLRPDDMQRLVDEVFRTLAEDGLALIETVNPHSVQAFRFFWLDRTHTIPVYPESALVMARSAGFPAATVYFPGGTGDLADDLRDCGDFTLVCAKRRSRLVDIGLLEA